MCAPLGVKRAGDGDLHDLMIFLPLHKVPLSFSPPSASRAFANRIVAVNLIKSKGSTYGVRTTRQKRAQQMSKCGPLNRVLITFHETRLSATPIRTPDFSHLGGCVELPRSFVLVAPDFFPSFRFSWKETKYVKQSPPSRWKTTENTFA